MGRMSTSGKGELVYINKDEMLDFYKKLDIIMFKYDKNYKIEEESETHKARIDEGLYIRLQEYESENQFSMLTKKSYEDAAENLDLVYGERGKTEDSIELIDLILNKIIGQYINIDGMERLFNMSYIDFEWEMHLSADYKMHNMKFYRDHFIHQIRNAYMMHMLLRHCGMEECVMRVLKDESASKISRYVTKCLGRQMRVYRDVLREEVLKNDPEFYLRNLIYMSSYMAALFHDIGYPEGHHLSSSERIIEYIAGLYNISDAAANMHKIFALLQNSLLFRLVPFQEINRKINEKRDHGAISAIVFLLNFYENGSIFQLPPYKSAAVELAGLAIYNHTNVYSLLKPEEKTFDAVRPCFTANPISYLLRLCDDLQEWDRTYFLVSDGSNILFCNKCRTPIIGVRSYTDEDKRIQISRYKCNCKSAVNHCFDTDTNRFCFTQAFDGISKFRYRRIYNVTVCDAVEIDQSKRKSENKLRVNLYYNTYKLLHAAFAHPTYAKYRIDELNQLKYMLESQSEMPHIYLEYFVTSNVVHIKVKMLEDYLANTEIPKLIGNVVKNDDGAWDGTAEELRKIISEWKEKIKQELSAVEEEFCIHQNFCKECSYCENVLCGMKKIVYLEGEKNEQFSSCQHEWNVRCLTWYIMGDICDAMDLKKKIEEDKRYMALWEERSLLIPDFKESFIANKDVKGKFFYETETRSMQEAEAELKCRCPVQMFTKYMFTALDLYIELYLCQTISRYNNMTKGTSVWSDIIKQKAKELSERYEEFDDLQCMVEDCFLQFQRMYSDITEFFYYPKEYYEQYKNGNRKNVFLDNAPKSESAEFYYTAALRYISSERYQPYLERIETQDPQYIDAYTDLYFFQLLEKKIEEREGKN